MKSFVNLATRPAGVSLVADDVLEFHAARLLLLLKLCGKANRIDGLTKMAKLDFFVRYPRFFNIACIQLGIPDSDSQESIESSMVRFLYGPWDKRYYHILSYLESKQLIAISPSGTRYSIQLTESGAELTNKLEDSSAFSNLVKQMIKVKVAFGNRSGSWLKDLIYQLFDEEVVKKSHGEVIK
jgi:DNA-binding PadR family transcriptional regulator